jgi:hypothetical protein
LISALGLFIIMILRKIPNQIGDQGYKDVFVFDA